MLYNSLKLLLITSAAKSLAITFQGHHRRTGNFLPGGALNHLPKKISQVAQIFMKELK